MGAAASAGDLTGAPTVAEGYLTAFFPSDFSAAKRVPARAWRRHLNKVGAAGGLGDSQQLYFRLTPGGTLSWAERDDEPLCDEVDVTCFDSLTTDGLPLTFGKHGDVALVAEGRSHLFTLVSKACTMVLQGANERKRAEWTAVLAGIIVRNGGSVADSSGEGAKDRIAKDRSRLRRLKAGVGAPLAAADGKPSETKHHGDEDEDVGIGGGGGGAARGSSGSRSHRGSRESREDTAALPSSLVPYSFDPSGIDGGPIDRTAAYRGIVPRNYDSRSGTSSSGRSGGRSGGGSGGVGGVQSVFAGLREGPKALQEIMAQLLANAVGGAGNAVSAPSVAAGALNVTNPATGEVPLFTASRIGDTACIQGRILRVQYAYDPECYRCAYVCIRVTTVVLTLLAFKTRACNSTVIQMRASECMHGQT